MSKNSNYDTIILEFKSFSGYSFITTMINMKFCLLPVFEHKIRYTEIKKELQNIQGLDAFLDFEIDDDDFVYCEFYYGYRMAKEKYLNLESITNGIKSFIHSYSDTHEMIVYSLNYTGVTADETAKDSAGFLDELKNVGANIIDEKNRIYTNPTIGSEKVYKANYSSIHEIVYDTVRAYEHAFSKEKIVYKKIISKGIISDLWSNDALVNSIINDEEFMVMMANESHIKKINGVYFVDISRI